MKIPAKFPADAITALVDTREQTPLDLPGLRCEPGTLTTGDYSVRGLESVIAIERKSLPDLVACCGRERERFDREVKRLMAYPVRALVVEASWSDIEAGNWRGKMTTKLLYIELDDVKIPLEGEQSAKGTGSGSAGAAIVFAGIAGLFHRGNNAKIKAGEMLNGFVAEDVLIDLYGDRAKIIESELVSRIPAVEAKVPEESAGTDTVGEETTEESGTK